MITFKDLTTDEKRKVIDKMYEQSLMIFKENFKNHIKDKLYEYEHLSFAGNDDFNIYYTVSFNGNCLAIILNELGIKNDK